MVGRLAQLVRATRLHRVGRGFESLSAHQPSAGAKPVWLGRLDQFTIAYEDGGPPSNFQHGTHCFRLNQVRLPPDFFAHRFKQLATIRFAQVQPARRGVDEAARGLVRVTQ